MMKFIYQNEEFSWEEWKKNYNNFVESLELPNEFLINVSYREFSLKYDIGYGIAIDKFRELYSMVSSARFALINANQKFYDSNVISWDSGYFGQLWMRTQYLKNAIVWYNSCEDYIYQILWFAYDMYSKPIDNSKTYSKALRCCTYKNINNFLEKLESQNSYAKILKKKVNSYREDNDVNYIRNLANSLKHKADIQFKGLEDIRQVRYLRKNFDSKWIEPKLLDVDEVIQRVKNVHIKLIKYGKYILNNMNIEEMFVQDENGIHLYQERKRSDYKKIIIK